MSRRKLYGGDGSYPADDRIGEAFCVNVAVHDMRVQDAYCAARGVPKSGKARVQASRWKKAYAARIAFLRAERAAAQDEPQPVDTSPQAIATLQREISAALQEASVQAKAFGHARLGNQIKASLVRHIGRVQRSDARRDGPLQQEVDDGEIARLASNIRRNFQYCRCEGTND